MLTYCENSGELRSSVATTCSADPPHKFCCEGIPSREHAENLSGLCGPAEVVLRFIGWRKGESSGLVPKNKFLFWFCGQQDFHRCHKTLGDGIQSVFIFSAYSYTCVCARVCLREGPGSRAAMNRQVPIELSVYIYHDRSFLNAGAFDLAFKFFQE